MESWNHNQIEENNLYITPNNDYGDMLVVIDMQNIYLEGQKWGCTQTMDCVKTIKKLIPSVDNVVFSQYVPPEHPSGCWVTYNQINESINKNKWNGEMIASLQEEALRYQMFSKTTYSSYGNKAFKEVAIRARRLIMTGVMAECCVLSTILDAVDTGVPVIYIIDGISGGSRALEQCTMQILKVLSPIHIHLMTSQEYIEARISKRF